MKINVLHCLDSFLIGGTETQSVRLITNLDREKYDLHIAVRQDKGPLRERLEGLGIPISEYPVKSLRGRSFLSSARRLARYLREKDIHVIHCHDYPTNILGLISAMLASTPVRIGSRREMGTRPFSEKAFQRIVWAGAQRIIVNSEAVKRLIVGEEFVDEEKVSVIYNCVETDKIVTAPPLLGKKRKELGFGAREPLIGMVANFYTSKDHPVLLRAVSRLVGDYPDLRVVLVGDGPERNNIVSCAEELGILDNIVFLGQRNDVYEIVGIFDVAVLSSHTEGFSNAVLEYMAAARPVVATTAGGNIDVIDDGECGFLVPVKDHELMAERIGSVLDDPGLASRLGKNARKKALENFTLDSMVGRTEEIYDTLVRENVPAVATGGKRKEAL